MSDKETKEPRYFSTTLTEAENTMIEELSSLTGLNKATAVKLHLRQTLPVKLAALRAEKANIASSANPNLTQINNSGQEKSENEREE